MKEKRGQDETVLKEGDPMRVREAQNECSYFSFGIQQIEGLTKMKFHQRMYKYTCTFDILPLIDPRFACYRTGGAISQQFTQPLFALNPQR